MKKAMHLSLRAGERIYVNGAVLRVDRKVTLELLNDAAFLLENQVMQAAQAVTPLRQLYFAVQLMLMEPDQAAARLELLTQKVIAMLAACPPVEVVAGLRGDEAVVVNPPDSLESGQAVEVVTPTAESARGPERRPRSPAG